jgi:predicted SprT family Zn-dependent metalloprotease
MVKVYRPIRPVASSLLPICYLGGRLGAKDCVSGMDGDQKSISLARKVFDSDGALPTLPALREMLGRLGVAWDCPDLPCRVKVVYNPRLTTTLGRAAFADMRLELNPRLLREHPDELAATLAHEAAHLVVHMRYAKALPHGREFKTLMRAVNLSPKATHSLPVEHLRKRRGRYLYLHRCGDCGQEFVARSVRRGYYCLACGPDMQWDIFRIPNTNSGLKLLEHLRRR